MGDTGPHGAVHRDPLLRSATARPVALRRGAGARRQGLGRDLEPRVHAVRAARPRTARCSPLPAPSIDTGAGPRARDDGRAGRDVELRHRSASRRSSRRRRELAKKTLRRAARATTTSRCASSPITRARTAFLIADGVMPRTRGAATCCAASCGARSATASGSGIDEASSCTSCASAVVDEMGDAYPELREAQGAHRAGSTPRSKPFRRTLDRGLQAPRRASSASSRSRAQTLPGEAVFKLYDTYGFPVDLTRVIAEERGFGVDEAGFDDEMDKQRARSGEFAGSGEAGGRRRATRSCEQKLGADQVPRLRGRRTRRRRARHRRRRRAAPTRRAGAKVGSRRPDAVLRRVGRADRRHRHDRRRRRLEVEVDRHAEDAGRASSCTSGEVERGDAAGRRRGHVHRRRRRGATRSAPTTRRRTFCTSRSSEVLGDARGAEGLARRARSAALRLRALLADDRRREAAGRGPRQRRDPPNADSVIEVLPFDEAKQRARSRCSARSTATRCASMRDRRRVDRVLRRHARAARGRHRAVQDHQRGRRRAGRAPHRGGDRRGRARLPAQARGRARRTTGERAQGRRRSRSRRASTSCSRS